MIFHTGDIRMYTLMRRQIQLIQYLYFILALKYFQILVGSEKTTKNLKQALNLNLLTNNRNRFI